MGKPERLTLADCERIVNFEVRRCGPIIGFDFDDMKQEGRLVAHHARSRVKGNTGRTYVRTSVRNALMKMKRYATANHRAPRDANGDVLYFWHLDAPIPNGEGASWLDQQQALVASPEDQAHARKLISVLETKLPADERELLTHYVLGALENRGERMRGRALLHKAERMLTAFLHRLESSTEKTMTKPNPKLPECHAKGSEPVGYGPGEKDCQDCPDKLSCLPASIDDGLIDVDVNADPEVRATQEGTLAIDVVLMRVQRRQEIRDAGGKVPPSLAYNRIPTEETMATRKTRRKTTTKAGPRKKPTKKKPTKKKPTKKAASKKKPIKTPAVKKITKSAHATRQPPGKATATKNTRSTKTGKVKAGGKKLGHGQVALLDDGRLLKWDGRTLPAPRKLSKDELRDALLRIGVPPRARGVYVGTKGIKPQIGQTLHMVRRDGTAVEIAITKDGFKVVKGAVGPGRNGTVYGSLSAACMWTSPTFRTVSCNDVFDFARHRNIEVRGKGVPKGSYRKLG